MKKHLFTLALFVTILLPACTLFRESESSSKEKLLAAAGFQIRPADTAAKQASLAKMTPYKTQMHTKGGVVCYVYADPKQGVLYVGGPAQYAAYQKLAEQQSIAEENEMAASEYEMSAADWGMWGPWNY